MLEERRDLAELLMCNIPTSLYGVIDLIRLARCYKKLVRRRRE